MPAAKAKASRPAVTPPAAPTPQIWKRWAREWRQFAASRESTTPTLARRLESVTPKATKSGNGFAASCGHRLLAKLPPLTAI